MVLFTFCSFLNRYEILNQLPEGRVTVLNEVNSTNQYIIDNIKSMQSGDACVTEYQTQGRGRRGKIWIMSLGQGIGLSVYWRLYNTPPSIIVFSVVISIIVAEILKNLGVSEIQIKWPNDLYVNGRKLAGILIEIITDSDRIAHLIIGIGINVAMCTSWTLKTKMSKNWINLTDLGIILDRNVLVGIIINTLRQKLKDFILFGYKPIISCWKNFDYLYNKSVILCIGSRIVRGIALGITEYGLLVVKESDSICFYAGENISVGIFS